jgi:hypothetical protein
MARVEPAEVAAACSDAAGMRAARAGLRRARKMDKGLFFLRDHARKSRPVKFDPMVIIAPRVDDISFNRPPLDGI